MAPQLDVDFGRRRQRREGRCSSVASFMGEGFRWKEFDAGAGRERERERDEKGKSERTYGMARWMALQPRGVSWGVSPKF